MRAPVWRIDPRALAAVREYAPRTRWMAAIECQLYPFLADVPVIPDLYSTSLKRRLSGHYQPHRILDGLQRFRPEQVLLDSRFDYPPALRDYLAVNYRARFPGAVYVQWVRRDIADPSHDWSQDPFREAVMSLNEARLKPFPLALHLLRLGRPGQAQAMLQLALDLQSPALAAHAIEARRVLLEIDRRQPR